MTFKKKLGLLGYLCFYQYTPSYLLSPVCETLKKKQVKNEKALLVTNHMVSHIDNKTTKQTNTQTNKQNTNQPNKQTSKQVKYQTTNQTNHQMNKLPDKNNIKPLREG